ncbi:MAG: hypothetical protein ISP83_07120 [Candidatus Poseidonia sp.]|nr:hypothetical protein [Poseidonia sp.]
MGYEINWTALASDPVLSSPQYQKWSQYSLSGLTPHLAVIKTELGEARASREASAVINYLAWLVRTVNLLA